MSALDPMDNDKPTGAITGPRDCPECGWSTAANDARERHAQWCTRGRAGGDVRLLEALTAALPELQRHGVRKLTLGGLAVELERVDTPWSAAGDEPAGDRDGDLDGGLPPVPPSGESDDLDTAAVES